MDEEIVFSRSNEVYGHVIETPSYALIWLILILMFQTPIHLVISIVTLWLLGPFTACCDNEFIQEPIE
jgi:hypothetical protein